MRGGTCRSHHVTPPACLWHRHRTGYPSLAHNHVLCHSIEPPNWQTDAIEQFSLYHTRFLLHKMALTVFADSTTTTTTRETRSTSNMIKTTSSTGISSTSKVTKVSKNATMTKKTRPSTVKTPQPSRDNEKENINPLTGLEQGISKKVKAVFGGNAKGNVVDREEVMLKASNVKTTRPQTRSVTSPAREKIARDIPAPSGATATVPKRRTRKSDPKASTSTILDDVLRLPPLEDTLAGRLLSARRSETDADRRARELTVRPLADLSEAFNVGGSVRAMSSII